MNTPSRGESLFLLAGALVFELLLAVAGWWLAPLLAHRTLSQYFSNHNLSVTLGYGLGGGLVATVLVLILYVLFADYRRVIFQDVIEQLQRIPPLALALMGVAAAFGEEIFFRGFLLSWLGIIPSSVLFGVLHVSKGKAWAYYALTAGLTGFGLGLLFLHTQSLVIPMLTHGSYNLLVTYLIAQDLFKVE